MGRVALGGAALLLFPVTYQANNKARVLDTNPAKAAIVAADHAPVKRLSKTDA